MNSQRHFQPFFFFFPQYTHLGFVFCFCFGGVFLYHTNLSQWEKNQTFPMNLFAFFWRIFFIKCFAVKTFLFFAFIQKHIFNIFHYYLLPAVSFCIVSLPSATEKPNPMILLLVLSQTLLLTSQLQLIYHSELCRWDGWKQDDFSPYLFLFPLSIKAPPLPLFPLTQLAFILHCT